MISSDPETNEAFDRLSALSALSAQRPVLHDDALIGLPGDVVERLGPYTEADPAAILMTYLVGVGALIGPLPYVPVGGARHGTVLDVVIVGKTSRARKGTSWADTSPVLRSADDAIDRIIVSGFGSGEAIVDAVRDPEGDEPVKDRRLLVLESEFARVLTVAERKDSILSQIIRCAWDGGRLEARTRKLSVVSTNSHISVLGHITREELSAKLTATDRSNGFANRMLFVYAERSKRLPSGGELPPDLVSQLGDRTKKALLFAGRQTKVQRTPDANEVWSEWYCSLDDGVDGLLGDLSARAEAQVLRLSLLYALLDQSKVIEAKHVRAAISVWSYCESSVKLIFEKKTGNLVADRLYEALVKAGDVGLDGTEQHALFARHVSSSGRDEARRLLERQGLIVTRTEGGTGGRDRIRSFACAESAESAERSTP